MCQIQFVYKFDNKNLSEKDIKAFKRLLLLGSRSNGDAWGYYIPSEQKLFKTDKNLAYEDLNGLDTVKTNLLFGHNRIATKGKPDINYNNHPFESDNFVVVHNGMLSNDTELKKNNSLVYKIETDSYVIPALLEKVYASTKDTYKAVYEVAHALTGSFSVLIYSKTDNRLFYFKERGTKFNLALVKCNDGDTLVGTTNDGNLSKIYTSVVRGFFGIRDVKMDYVIPTEHEILEITPKSVEIKDTFVEPDYQKGRTMYWADLEQKWKYVEYVNPYTKSKDTQCSMIPYRDYNGYNQYDDIDETSFNQSFNPDSKEKTDYKSLTEIINRWEDTVKEFITDFTKVEVLNTRIMYPSKTIVFILDKIISHSEKSMFMSEFAFAGKINFRDRKNGKVSELSLELDEMCLNPGFVESYFG